MTAPTVGVLGATGAVGRAVVQELLRLGVHSLRLGSRRPALKGGASTEWWPEPVDVLDEAAVLRFCAGCDVVVQCTGPVHEVGARVCDAAARLGVDVVDVNDPYNEETARAAVAKPASVILTGAGEMPGLSGLLPRLLVTPEWQPAQLTLRVGGLLVFPKAAAQEFMQRLAQPRGEAMAAYRDHERKRTVLAVERDQALPFFPERATALPYLTEEAVALARELGLPALNWFTVFTGPQTLALLERLRAGLPSGQSVEQVAAALTRASQSDAAGRLPYQVMTAELSDSSCSCVRSLVLRVGAAASALTGLAAALGVLAVIEGKVAAGRQRYASALDPYWVWSALQASPPVTHAQILTEPLSTAWTRSEGEIV